MGVGDRACVLNYWENWEEHEMITVHHGGKNLQNCSNPLFLSTTRHANKKLICQLYSRECYSGSSWIPFKQPALQESAFYVLLEKKLRGLRTKLHNQVSVSDLYIPAIGPPIRQTDWERYNRATKHKCRNWDWGRAVSFLGIFVSNFGVLSLQWVRQNISI